MSRLFPKCSGADFSRIYFILEFVEDFSLSLEILLCMRAGLRAAGHRLTCMEGFAASSREESFSALLDPSMPSDPVAVRLFQKPSPYFVFRPSASLPKKISAGEHLEISAICWGKGIQQIGKLGELMQAMGNHGLNQDQGFFELVEIESEDWSGRRCSIWSEGASFESLTPVVHSVETWLGNFSAGEAELVLEFLTPTRLISKGKPLFQPTFAGIFPFILRRVTSMLYHACYQEMDVDYKHLIALAGLVREETNNLAWEDCKVSGGKRELGGFTGELLLAGKELSQIGWLLHLGALMNIGKGAAYGAGFYRLESC